MVAAPLEAPVLSLRAMLRPRLYAAALAMLRRYPPHEPRATVADHARWERVRRAADAIERGAVTAALYELGAVERLAGVGE